MSVGPHYSCVKRKWISYLFVPVNFHRCIFVVSATLLQVGRTNSPVSSSYVSTSKPEALRPTRIYLSRRDFSCVQVGRISFGIGAWASVWIQFAREPWRFAFLFAARAFRASLRSRFVFRLAILRNNRSEVLRMPTGKPTVTGISWRVVSSSIRFCTFARSKVHSERAGSSTSQNLAAVVFNLREVTNADTEHFRFCPQRAECCIV